MPLVSVVIPTHNRADMLDEALRSVFAQTYRDFEVIVVDDGSTDHTSDVVRQYSPQVQYIQQENQGRSCARNAGIRAARGAYVAFLDDDDTWLPSKLELQVNTLESRPNAAVVYGPVYVVDGGRRRLAPKEPPPPEVFREQLLTLSWECLLRISPGTPSVVMVRTDALVQTGFFDPAVEPLEDWELWVRLAARGFRFAYVREPVAEYRIHGGNTTRDPGQLHAVVLALEKVLASSETPQCIRARRRHYLSRAWIFVGNECYSSLQLVNAWKAWLRGVQMDPSVLTSRSLLLMGRTLCGSRLLGWARQAKQTLFRGGVRGGATP